MALQVVCDQVSEKWTLARTTERAVQSIAATLAATSLPPGDGNGPPRHENEIGTWAEMSGWTSSGTTREKASGWRHMDGNGTETSSCRVAAERAAGSVIDCSRAQPAMLQLRGD
jgi:hypothetical protein